jgi:hypothetical protein
MWTKSLFLTLVSLHLSYGYTPSPKCLERMKNESVAWGEKYLIKGSTFEMPPISLRDTEIPDLVNPLKVHVSDELKGFHPKLSDPRGDDENLYWIQYYIFEDFTIESENEMYEIKMTNMTLRSNITGRKKDGALFFPNIQVKEGNLTIIFLGKTLTPVSGILPSGHTSAPQTFDATRFASSIGQFFSLWPSNNGVKFDPKALNSPECSDPDAKVPIIGGTKI